jgi:aspartate/methionine/tyrosine aminotransferase
MKFTCQEISLKDFAEQLIDKYGVLILPGDNFFTASLDVSRHFRIGFGRANFPLAMKVFEDAVMELIPNAQPQKV